METERPLHEEPVQLIEYIPYVQTPKTGDARRRYVLECYRKISEMDRERVFKRFF
ncbi:MAG: hypothetical protein HFG26_07465 [Provencibacterium sp.]|jgi:hypothetical protein|nr:hypothetical protein [Provencibacterium sp.]